MSSDSSNIQSEEEDFYMAIAILAAKRSKDPRTQVGACIVNKDNVIVAIGYNGMPNGCPDTKLPWGKGPGLENKSYYVCHAAMNAIINKNSASVKDCKIYVGLLPCIVCAKIIIQAGITHVIYMESKDEYKDSLSMFEKAGINHRKYTPPEDVVLVFEKDRPKVLSKCECM